MNLQYQKNYTTQQNNELAGSVQSNGSRVSFLNKPYRSTSQSDNTIKTKHLLSPELSRTTLLIDEADAISEANRLLNLYKIKRDRYQVTITANNQMQLMETVKITLDRMNLNQGKHFLIIGIKHVFSNNQTIIDCWGWTNVI